MTKGKVKRYCVWENGTDAVIAIDLPAKICAGLMGCKLSTFYVHATARNGVKYTIIESDKLFTESEESA